MKTPFFFLLFLLLLLVSLSLPAQLSDFIVADAPSSPSLHIATGSYLVLHELNTELNQPVFGGGTVKLSGARVIFYDSNDRLIPRLEISLDSGHNVLVTDTSGVSEALIFSSPHAHLELQGSPFVIGLNATIQGYGPDNFVLTNTNNSRGLIKQGVGMMPFEFPVGFDEQQYNPVVLQAEEGALDMQVRALEHVLINGGSGPPLATEVVDASWEIKPVFEPNPFFSILQAEWRGGDELPGFDRNRCGVARFVPSSGWDLMVANVAPAFGNDPFGRERVALNQGGFFAVGGKILAPETSAEVDILMGGNYVGGGLMTDALRENNLLPTTEPYTGLGFSQAGFGGGETVNPMVFSVAGPDAIVDWLLIEIRDGADPSVLVGTQAAFLQRDGDIVDLDGVSDLRLRGIPEGSYFFQVQHRNHVTARSATPLAFGPDGIEFGFDVGPDNWFGGELGAFDLGDGFYGMIPGDVDGNGQIQNVDAQLLSAGLGIPGYQRADTDLNGQVQNTDVQLQVNPNQGRGRQF